MLKVSDTLSIISNENKEAAKVAARLTAGNILNDRAVKLITPQLPMMAKGYAQTEIGKAVIANVVAGAVVHFAPTNDKAVMASQAMIHSAIKVNLNHIYSKYPRRYRASILWARRVSPSDRPPPQ